MLKCLIFLLCGAVLPEDQQSPLYKYFQFVQEASYLISEVKRFLLIVCDIIQPSSSLLSLVPGKPQQGRTAQEQESHNSC